MGSCCSCGSIHETSMVTDSETGTVHFSERNVSIIFTSLYLFLFNSLFLFSLIGNSIFKNSILCSFYGTRPILKCFYIQNNKVILLILAIVVSIFCS
ncbi:hypothetical protein EDC94DRAFT_624749 [Helicostylum pulchrum]|nr:hypothetical protein EDC94DRAFT_624749 [Helicostylum pulchrum]